MNLIKALTLVAFTALSLTSFGFSSPSVIVEKLEDICPKYGPPKAVCEAVIEIESNGNHAATRFEPGQIARAKRITDNPQLQKEYATSWGDMQVMGWHAPAMGISINELRQAAEDPWQLREIGSAILGRCWLAADKQVPKTPKRKQSMESEEKRLLEITRRAGTCYNGAKSYGEKLAKKVLPNLARRG